MRRAHFFAAYLFFSLLPGWVPTVLAQSANNNALRWFNRGLQEKNVTKRIDALTKAIAYDSLFTQALYQLGQIYARQDDFTQAAVYLEKARAHLSASGQEPNQAQLLLELARIYRKLGNWEGVESALREAQTLANTPPQQAVIMLELSDLLYQQQRDAEAFAEFLSYVSRDTAQNAARQKLARELQAFYARAQRHAAAGEVETAVAIYDSLLQRAGVLAIAAQVAQVDSTMRWPLSAALKPAHKENYAVYLGGALAAFVLLPLLGVFVFSPMSRANYYLWRKNYLAATQIFEKLLTRHPQRAHLYTPLAESYLQLGRNDERALKVYKTVTQLNLPTRKRDEINSVLAQKYLAEGRTDPEVIEVLENALKVESRKQQLSLKAKN